MASSASGQPPVNGAANAAPVKKRIKKNTTNPFAVARQPGGARPVPVTNGRSTPTAKPPPVPAPLQPGQYSGFTDPKIGKYTDYRLVVTKKDLMDGLRHHILHLADNKKSVDIRDQAQFPRPAHLHRRDPMAEVGHLLKDDQLEIKDGLTVNEREEQGKKNELRKQEREANLAQIAPTQSSRKGLKQSLKTKSVFNKKYTEEEKRRIQTNYEEKLPWHLEDFDNKHCFVGENQIPSAHRHVAFAYERLDAANARFRLVPVEKVYEFRPKRKVIQPQTIDEIEAAAAAKKKRTTMPEWLERVEQKSLDKKKAQQQQQRSQMFTGASSNKYAGRDGEGADLDFDDDELFADDEEGDVLKNQDEDEDYAKKRIKEDQLKANYFEVKDEREFDEEEEEERKEELARKANFRKIRRALEKHEHDYNHASDSEYSDSSTSSEERARLEVERLKAQAAALDSTVATPGGTGQTEAPAGTLLPDGTTTTSKPPLSGTTTPSGLPRKSQLTDTEGPSSKSRKRPGSPILSEAGSGVDTDGSTRKKKHKSRHLSTQPGSRAGSPAPTATKLSSSGGKLPGSTLPSRPASTAPGSGGAAETPMPSLQDIKETLAKSLPGGLTIPELLNVQPHPRDRSKEFIQLVKSVAKSVTMENGKKVLVLREGVK